MTAVDVALAVAGVWLLGGVAWRMRPRPRHVWGELDSTSIAHALRKR